MAAWRARAVGRTGPRWSGGMKGRRARHGSIQPRRKPRRAAVLVGRRMASVSAWAVASTPGGVRTRAPVVATAAAVIVLVVAMLVGVGDYSRRALADAPLPVPPPSVLLSPYRESALKLIKRFDSEEGK